MAMRTAVLLLLAGLVHAQDRGDEFLAQERAAFEHFEKEEWDRAIAAFEKQIAIFGDNPRPYYNIACAYARQGKTERAITWLRLAIRHGWRMGEHMDGDSDLDSIRGEVEYRMLRTALERLAPIGPKELPPSSTASAESAAEILADGILERASLDLDRRLFEEHQIRERLFAHYDRRMARLARYLHEHGDARDAHEAARERVRLASLYRLQGAEDAGAALVRRTAADFVAGWPTSPHLYEIRLWRASVDDGTGGLVRLMHDAPRGEVAARAIAEILVRDPSTRDTLYPRFVRRYRDTEVGRDLLETRLGRVRLEQDGLPEGLEFDPPAGDLAKGRVVVGVVTADHASLATAFAEKRFVLVVLGDQPWKGMKAPLAKDPVDAARRLGVWEIPLFLTFEDGKLVEAKSLPSEG